MHGKPMTDSRRIIEYLGDVDHFGEFPITADIIDDKYRQNNGDCKEPDNFYPWVAIDDENRVVGHFIINIVRENPFR